VTAVSSRCATSGTTPKPLKPLGFRSSCNTPGASVASHPDDRAHGAATSSACTAHRAAQALQALQPVSGERRPGAGAPSAPSP
jgi:hypothetical protein